MGDQKIKPRLPLTAICALAAALTGCSRSSPESELLRLVPPQASVVAGLRLRELRTSPLYSRLPQPVRTYAEGLKSADRLLLALSDSGLLVAADGQWQTLPEGAVALDRRIAVWGAETATAHAAQAFRKRAPAPDIATLAAPFTRFPIWAIARGSAVLPLAGNLANLNNLLRSTSHTLFGLTAADPAQLEIHGVCRSPEAAQRLEDTLRAFLSLAGARLRSPLLDNLKFQTEGNTVRITSTVPAAALDFPLR